MRSDACIARRSHSLYHIIAVLLLTSLLILPLSVAAQDENSIATLKQMGKAFASVAEKASPAVVSIKAERTVTQQYQGFGDGKNLDPFSDDFFNFFFRRQAPRQQQTPQRKQQQVSQGSGFIISPDGYILTNNHVVGEADKVWVELQGGQTLQAEIKGLDPDSDVAVIKIKKKDLKYLELADSDQLEVGEWVLAIGNPLGLSHTVTAGIVSAKHRAGFGLATLENFIQTDAAINFGNSGGPLVDLDGKVVGINTAIAGSSGNIGIGFAIPINMARHIYEQLIKTGKVERGFLGVLPNDMDADLAKELGLDDNKGVLISHVDEGSAAEKAGLQNYDIIIELDDKIVGSANELRNQIAMLKPGAEIKMLVMRKGKRIELTAKLDKRDSENSETAAGTEESADDFGFSVRELSDELAKRFGYEGESGVIISEVSPDSEAARKGLTPGILIKEVDQTPVKNVKEFTAAMKKAKKKGTALLLVRQGRYMIPLVLKLSD